MSNEEKAKLQNECTEFEHRIAGLELQLSEHWTEDQSRLLTSLRIKLDNNKARLAGISRVQRYSPYKVVGHDI